MVENVLPYRGKRKKEDRYFSTARKNNNNNKPKINISQVGLTACKTLT